MKLLRYALLVIYMWLVFAVISTTAETLSLPGFDVMDRDGAAWTSADLTREGTWVLIYVRPGCRTCERLLSLLSPDQLGRMQAVVVLVGASPAKAEALAGDYPGLAEASWYIDSRGEGFSRLKLTGAPVVLGLHGADIAWRLQGLVPGSKELKSILSSWLAR